MYWMYLLSCSLFIWFLRDISIIGVVVLISQVDLRKPTVNYRQRKKSCILQYCILSLKRIAASANI